MVDDTATPKKPDAKPDAPKSVRLSFRAFAAPLDLPTANALRVKLGLRHADIDQDFAEPDLQAALDALNGKETDK